MPTTSSSEHEAYAHYYLPRLRRWTRSTAATNDGADDRVVKLVLSGTDMTDDDCRLLAEALQENGTVRYLVTSGNPLVSRDGVLALAKALAGHPTLEVWRVVGSSADASESANFADLDGGLELHQSGNTTDVVSESEEATRWFHLDMLINKEDGLIREAATSPAKLVAIDEWFAAMRQLVATAPRLRRLFLPAPLPSRLLCSVIDKEFVLEDESTHFGNAAAIAAKSEMVTTLRRTQQTSVAIHRHTRLKGLIGAGPAALWAKSMTAAMANSTSIHDATADLSFDATFAAASAEVPAEALPFALGVMVETLCACTTIKRVNVSGYGRAFGDRCAAVIAPLLRSPTLPMLDLQAADNDIGYAGATTLITALRESKNRALLDLGLSGNRATDQAALNFLELVEKGGCAISNVDLSRNCIEPTLVSRLLHSLALNSQPERFRASMRDVQANTSGLQRLVFSQQGDAAKLNDVSCRLLLQAMRSNTSVTFIDLSSNNITDEGAVHLADVIVGNPGLRKLILQFNQITDEGAAVLLAALPRNPSIELLDLKFQTPGVAPHMMDKVRWLSSLNVHPIEIKTKGLLILQNEVSLTSFRIATYDGKRRLTNAGLDLLADMLAVNFVINDLCIANHPRTDLVDVGQWLPKLFTSIGARLETLDLSGNQFDDSVGIVLDEALRGAGGGPTAPANKLKTLILQRNNFTSDMATRFATTLRDVNHVLTRIDLDDNPRVSAIDQQSVTYAADLNKYDRAFKTAVLAVANNDPHVRELNLVQVEKMTAWGTSHHFARRYDDLAAELLGQSLEQNGCVTSVNLSGNSIGDRGAAALGEMLKVNTRITALHLMSNEIGDEGLAALNRALIENHNVRVLTLEGNRGIKSVPLQKSLAASLAQNSQQSDGADDTGVSTAAIYNAALTTKRAKLSRAAEQDQVMDKAIFDDAMKDFHAAAKRKAAQQQRQLEASRADEERRLLTQTRPS